MRAGSLSLTLAALAAVAASGGAAAADFQPSTYRGTCKLVIDGTTYIDIKKTCPIYSFNSQPNTLIVNSDGETDITGYFAYVTVNEDGTATGSWNATKAYPNARTLLGEDFTLKNGCWSNKRATICAYK